MSAEQMQAQERQWVSSDGKAVVRLSLVNGVFRLSYEDVAIEGAQTLQTLVQGQRSAMLEQIPGGYGELYARGAAQVLVIERRNGAGHLDRLEAYADPADGRNSSQTRGWSTDCIPTM